MFVFVALIGLRTRSVRVPARAEYRRAGGERRAERAVGLAVSRRSRRRGPRPAPRAAAAPGACTHAPPRAAMASARVRQTLQELAVARGPHLIDTTQSSN